MNKKKNFYLKYPWITSILSVALMFIAGVFITRPTFQWDDIFPDLLYSGAFGGNFTNDWVFSNAFFARFLSYMYDFLNVRWYAVVQYIVFIICFVFLFRVLLKRVDSASKFVTLCLVIFIMLFELIRIITFTLTAGVAVFTGIFMIFCHEKDTKYASLVFPVILIAIGSLIRYSVIITFVMLTVVLLFLMIFRKGMDIKKIVSVIAAFVLCFGINMLSDRVYKSNPNTDKMRSYSNQRSLFVDYEPLPYDSSIGVYKKVSWSENDYKMAGKSLLLDQNTFSEEKISYVNSSSKKYNPTFSVKNIISAAVKVIKHLTEPDFLVLVAIIVALSLCIMLQKQKKYLIYIFYIAIPLGISFGLNIMGRCPARVEFPVYCFIIALLMFDYLQIADREKKLSLYISYAMNMCIVIALIAGGAVYLSRTAPKNINLLTEYLEKHDENVYLYSSTTRQFIKRNMTLKNVERNSLRNMVTAGGVSLYGDSYVYANDEFGLTGSFFDLVNKDNVYFLAEENEDKVSYLEEYFTEHSKDGVKYAAEKADEISRDLAVYKFRKVENK